MPVDPIEEPDKTEETRCGARPKVFTEKMSDQYLQTVERDFWLLTELVLNKFYGFSRW